MRLIDADELKLSHCKECTLYPNKCMGKDCDWGSIAHINMMPTVDAIPVEWIKEWRDEIVEHPAYTERERYLVMDELKDMLGAWAERKEE